MLTFAGLLCLFLMPTIHAQNVTDPSTPTTTIAPNTTVALTTTVAPTTSVAPATTPEAETTPPPTAQSICTDKGMVGLFPNPDDSLCKQ